MTLNASGAEENVVNLAVYVQFSLHCNTSVLEEPSFASFPAQHFTAPPQLRGPVQLHFQHIGRLVLVMTDITVPDIVTIPCQAAGHSNTCNCTKTKAYQQLTLQISTDVLMHV